MNQQSKRRYEELVELAKFCLLEAKASATKDLANELRLMAKKYQKQAADIDGGKMPNIDED